MPDYRKKRRNRIFSSPSRPKTATRAKSGGEDIKMTPDGGKRAVKPKAESNMKVVRGRKLEQKKKLTGFSAFAAVVLILVLVFQLILPAGIIQTVSNTVAVIGSGSYPIELESNDTLSVVPMGTYYYVLSDTGLCAYSNSGKELFKYSHGFENPVLKTSKWGALLYGQGGTQVNIFTLKGLKKTVDTEKNVICAAISNSGAYALVTESDTYACTVSVYNKYDKNLYEWYSAEDVVNNVAISPNTKKIAVSTFSASGGEFNSKVSVLNFKSATPEFSEEFSETLVYDINTVATSRFSVVTSNGSEFVKWNKYAKSEYKSDYNISILRAASHETVAVWRRESDPQDNKITVFSKTGKLKYEFEFKGIISDIRLFGGHIYCMSDTEIYLLGSDGTVLRTATCGFGGVALTVTGTNTVCVITDNKIEKIKLEEEAAK
ncbi:MAG: hypothetical protein IJ432_00490 [Clostridia bacterium]|nr:hypothetical protein [Clostridia bacterium]